MTYPRVIHSAQALVDEVFRVPNLPERGQNVMAGEHHRYAASAVTTLLAAARSGAACVHAGAHGTGPNGDLIRSVLGAAGVALSAPPVPDLDTGVCVVLVEPSAERTFVTTRGAERHITPASLATSSPRAGDVVCVSGYTLLEPTRDPLLTWLADLPEDVVVVLDPGAAFAGLPAQVRTSVLERVHVWTSNAEEAGALTAVLGLGESAEAVARLVPPRAVVIVRDGPRGCVVRDPGAGGSVVEVAGYPQDAVDTNGAGDTHTGTLVAAWLSGLPWAQAARRANAAGAITVTRFGPDTAPTAREIDDFLAAQPAV